MEHINTLLQKLSSLYPFSDAFRETLRPLLTIKTFKRGQTLDLKEPAVLYYIIKGLAKGSYDDVEGKEHIIRFWREKEVMLIMHPVSESFTITLLEDSDIIYLTPRRLIYVYNRFADAPKLASKLLAREQVMANVKIGLSSLSARQAYQEFKVLFPYRRIKLKDIASYLEITPGTLSEIRRIEKL